MRRVQQLAVEGYDPPPGHLKPEWRSIEPLPLCRERIHPASGTFAHRSRPGSRPPPSCRQRPGRVFGVQLISSRGGREVGAPDPGSPR